jgi:hypothetical protein
MPSTFVLDILSASRNGTTGHRSFTAQIIEVSEDGKSETAGAPETHGIAESALALKYGQEGLLADWLTRWREDVKKKMLARYQVRAQIDTELGKWVGQRY